MIISPRNKAKLDFPVDLDAVLTNFQRQAGWVISDYEVLKKISRPFSELVKIRVTIDSGDKKNLYVKYYQSLAEKKDFKRVKQDYETALFWFDKFKSSDEFCVPRPLYCDANKYIVITEESRGANLSWYINQHGRFFPSKRLQQHMGQMTKKVGMWLTYFQNLPVNNDHISGKLTLDDFFEYLEPRLVRLVENKKNYFSKDYNAGVHNYIRNLWSKVADEDKERICFLHSDLSGSNILIYKSTVTVLDFSKKEIGSPFKDLTRFYHQINLLKNKPVFQKPFIDYLLQQFLEGYGQPDINQHPLFKIYYMIHLINHLNKSSRYWEHSFFENLYNRWMVKNTMLLLKKTIL